MKMNEYHGNHIAKEPHYKKVNCPLCDGKGIVDVETIRYALPNINISVVNLEKFMNKKIDDWKDDKYEDICPLCEGAGYIEEVK